MPDVSLPDGTVVRASALADRDRPGIGRDAGLYLDPAWKPDWPATVISWPDFGLPSCPKVAASQIVASFDLARAGARLEVGCLGGLGRTGTVFACFAVLCGLSNADAIEWVRTRYDRRAIETLDQERWVAWFEQHHPSGKYEDEAPGNC